MAVPKSSNWYKSNLNKRSILSILSKRFSVLSLFVATTIFVIFSTIVTKFMPEICFGNWFFLFVCVIATIKNQMYLVSWEALWIPRAISIQLSVTKIERLKCLLLNVVIIFAILIKAPNDVVLAGMNFTNLFTWIWMRSILQFLILLKPKELGKSTSCQLHF